jgi:NAD dependent epimerase/dehydratase family enzyme
MQVVSWIPMDAVSQAILDVGFARKQVPGAINFVHPKPIPWASMISSISDALVAQEELNVSALPLIPFGEWVARLESKSKTAKDEEIKNLVSVLI